ncbi:MAG: bacterial Ig-like domain-containing protein [Treponema sp.]|jgi:hypothetical protein|nr:bacterial Ig-like domain-containing protein [Treponema sp.]
MKEMKARKGKAGNGRWAAGLLTIGLPLIMAAGITMGGCTTFQSIELTPPARTVFGQGEAFTYEGLHVTGITKKGEAKDIPGKSIVVSGYNPDRIGEQTITVAYRKISATYTVTVIGVERITIDQAPIAVRQGMDIDRPALHITVSYGDRTAPRSIRGSSPGVNISGYDKDAVGVQTITVDYYGKTAAFDVTVAALTGIRITKLPDKVSYFSGEPLDLAGLEATGTWQGAGEAPVTPEYVSGFDSNTEGDQTVMVEVQGKQASFTVTVKEPAGPAVWTPAQGIFAKNVTGMAYGNGKFVAIGYDDKPEEKIVAYSTDGSTWTKAPSANVFGKNIIGIVYGNGIFVVAGYNDDIVTTVNNESYVNRVNRSVIAYSADGITWTKAATPEYFRNTRIFFGNGKFIAIGDYRYQQYVGTAEWVTSYYQIESSNGITWSGRSVISLEASWDNINCGFFDGGKFVALVGDRYIYSTNDGKSWKAGENIRRPITGVVSGNGKMIGIGPGNYLAWSTDGIIWTDADQRDDTLRNGNVNDVAYGFGMFVVVGSRGNILYSRDGYVWTKVPSSTFGSTDIRYVAYGDGKFVAIGDNGRIAYSNRID